MTDEFVTQSTQSELYNEVVNILLLERVSTTLMEYGITNEKLV